MEYNGLSDRVLRALRTLRGDKTLVIVLFTALMAVTVKSGNAEAKSKAPTAENPIVLVFSSHNAGGGFWHKHVVEAYFHELEKRTGGRIKIEEHWNGELVGLMDAYDAMAKGVVDIAEYFPSMLTGRFPMDDIVAFSPVNTHCYRPGRVLLELGREFPQMNKPYEDSKLLYREPAWSVGIGTTHKRLYDLEHSKGMKLTPVGRWSAARMEALGWSPTSVLPQDATSALQTGVIDGTGISMYLLWEFGWGSIIKHITVPVHVDEMLVNCSMNLQTWNKLPKDIQEIIDGMQDWTVDMMDKAVLLQDQEARPKATKEFGIEFIELSQEQKELWDQRTRPVMSEYMKDLESKGLPGKKFMSRFLELDRKYSDPQYAW